MAAATSNPSVKGTSYAEAQAAPYVEREQLIDNRQELLAAFENQATERERALAVLQSMRSGAGLQRINTRPAPACSSSQRRPQAADQHTSAPSPWLWQKAGTSVAVLRSPAGQHWVRLQHRDGTQKLVP